MSAVLFDLYFYLFFCTAEFFCNSYLERQTLQSWFSLAGRYVKSTTIIYHRISCLYCLRCLVSDTTFFSNFLWLQPSRSFYTIPPHATHFATALLFDRRIFL